MPTSILESLFSSFRLLVRLDCQGVPLDCLPKAVGNLIHLKYLNFRNTNIMTIPKFIGKLQNLETLNLKYTQVRELPSEINKLINLRCLLVSCVCMEIKGVKLKEGIGHLRALQKLRMVDAGDDGEGIMRELKNLKQIKNLGIRTPIRENGKLLCSAMQSMTSLRSLAIAAAGMDEVLDLESLTDPPQHLQRLYLTGCLQKLRLNWSRLMEDPLPLLKDLSALLELQLWNACEGDELRFQGRWFMKLKVLKIHIELLQCLALNCCIYIHTL